MDAWRGIVRRVTRVLNDRSGVMSTPPGHRGADCSSTNRPSNRQRARQTFDKLRFAVFYWAAEYWPPHVATQPAEDAGLELLVKVRQSSLLVDIPSPATDITEAKELDNTDCATGIFA